jgi:hypothetical protein
VSDAKLLPAPSHQAAELCSGTAQRPSPSLLENAIGGAPRGRSSSRRPRSRRRAAAPTRRRLPRRFRPPDATRHRRTPRNSSSRRLCCPAAIRPEPTAMPLLTLPPALSSGARVRVEAVRIGRN